MSRTVVVTGATDGVGRATATAFAARGDAVALLARGEQGLRAAADEINVAGGRALPVLVDVADADAVAADAARIEVELGPIDVWINVAFSSVFAPFWEVTAEEYRRATEVSYLGYVYGTMAALKHMRPRDRGTVVQVGSALAYRGIPVNTPQFSWVLSRLPRRPQPVPPIYQPEVAARAVLHAADHPRRREYWVGASTAATLAANAVAPGLLDRYLGRTGFASQQTDQSQDPEAPVNLCRPADGPHGRDFGAHGAFDARTVHHDLQPWASRHHGLLGAVAAGAGAGAALWAIARGGRR